MKFYFVPRPEPLIRSKRLEMGLLTQRERCAARRSGQRPGQRSGAGRLSQPLAQRENPRHYRGSPSGASRTRTGGLLGAIQALSQLSYSPGGALMVAAHSMLDLSIRDVLGVV